MNVEDRCIAISCGTGTVEEWGTFGWGRSILAGARLKFGRVGYWCAGG